MGGGCDFGWGDVMVFSCDVDGEAAADQSQPIVNVYELL